MGNANNIYDLQNYITGPAGSDFQTVNYFPLLTGLSVRNNVQPEVGSQPVDFIALRMPTGSVFLAPSCAPGPRPVGWFPGRKTSIACFHAPIRLTFDRKDLIVNTLGEDPSRGKMRSHRCDGRAMRGRRAPDKMQLPAVAGISAITARRGAHCNTQWIKNIGGNADWISASGPPATFGRTAASPVPWAAPPLRPPEETGAEQSSTSGSVFKIPSGE
jgi:hypothetical protein